MKIAFIISSLGAGGAERVLTQIANYWADQKGHDVHILLLRPKKETPFYPLSSRITLHSLGHIKRNGDALLTWGKRILSCCVSLRQALKNLKPNYLISFVNTVNILTLFLTRGLKIPTIISERVDPREHNITIIGNTLRRLLYPLANTLIVQGEYIVPFFSYMAEKVIVIPNAVPKAMVQHTPNDKPPIIINVGRLARQKGQDILIRAFFQANKICPGWHLDIYGQGPEEANLMSLVESLNLQNHVTFQGLTSDIHQHLSKASLFCFPSRFEGFPNALAEAMAVGLPVIASDCGGNLELVDSQKNGLIFPVDDVDYLTQYLTELMTDPKKCLRLGTDARKSVKKFDPKSVLAQWDHLLEGSNKAP